MEPHIFIATPAYGGKVDLPYLESLLSLKDFFHTKKIASTFRSISNSDIVMTRNAFASILMQDETYSHILFIDADMSFHPSAVLKLINSRHDVCGAIYNGRTLDFELLVQKAQQLKDKKSILSHSLRYNVRPIGNPRTIQLVNGFVKNKGIGMGLCLISRKSLIDLIATGHIQEKPESWRMKFKDVLKGKLYGFFDVIDSEDGPLSEDYSFCWKWINYCNGDVWGLATDKVGHTGPVTFVSAYIDCFQKGSEQPA